MKTLSTKKLINLQQAVFENFKPEYQDTLTKIAAGTYDGSRGDLFRAFQAAGAKVTNTADRALSIASQISDKKWTISLTEPHIQLKNNENPLSQAARSVLKEANTLLEAHNG